MNTLLKNISILAVLFSVSTQAFALVWGEDNWGESEWGQQTVTEPVPPPDEPIPEAVKVTTIGAQKRNATIGLGAYSDNGTPTFANDFVAGDFVTIIGELAPDPVDVGVNGELYAAFLSVIGGKASLSFLNEDGNVSAWDGSLPALGPAAIATPLEESHQLSIFEGNLQAGTHKFTFAYKADGGPLVFMKPVTIKITE